jgi:hypothetical protein
MRAEANAVLTRLDQIDSDTLNKYFGDALEKAGLFAGLGPRESDHIRNSIFEPWFQSMEENPVPLSFQELLGQEDPYPNAEERLRSLARSGNRNAVFQLGKFLLLSGKETQGRQVLMKMFEKGDIRARKVLLKYFQENKNALKKTAEESEMNDYCQVVSLIWQDIKNQRCLDHKQTLTFPFIGLISRGVIETLAK